MWNEKCGTTVIGPQVRPLDCSYYAVYHTPCVARAVVNCIMRMWKDAFCACVHVTVICHLLQGVFNWKVMRSDINNDINKSYYCVWRCSLYPQGLHHAKHVSVTSRYSVKNGWMNWASFWHGSFLSPILHCVQKKFWISSKIMVFLSGTLSQTLYIENIALVCQSSIVETCGSLSVCSRLLHCPSVTGRYSRPTQMADQIKFIMHSGYASW